MVSPKFSVKKLTLILVLCILTVLLTLGTFFFKMYRVSHYSMANTFTDGDRVLVSTFRDGNISKNEILIFSHLGSQYIKRCVAVAGDTLQILDWKVKVNSSELESAGTMRLTTPHNGRSMEYKSQDSTNRFDISVFQEYHQYWNLKDFGPYIVPKRDLSIELTDANIKLYSSVIIREIGNAKFKVLIAKTGSHYQFKEDYYFMVGDNRPASTDSRSFGAIHKSQVLGKVLYVIWQNKKQGNHYQQP